MKKCMGKELGEKIQASLDRWHYIKEHGTQDPFWEDGLNMNLVRNHIIYWKRMCMENLTPDEYPHEFNLETPPEVPNKYMARKEEIAVNAEAALTVLQKDPNYLWIKANAGSLSTKEKKDTHVEQIIRYPSLLKESIDKENLVYMRRSVNTGRFIEDFKKCRARIEAIIAKRKVSGWLPPLDESPGGKLKLNYKEKELSPGQISFLDLDMI